MSRFRLFVIVFGVAAGLVFAQGERATISGTATDSTGAVVPRVTVTVRNERTNIVNKAESNSAGLFVVPALEPGSYELTAEKQGFRAFRVSGIPLSVGLAATVNAKLEVGQLSEAVQVTASAVQLEAQTSGMGETVGTRAVAELPLIGRDPRQLSALAPGVIPTRGQVGAGGGAIGMAGNSRIAGGLAQQKPF
jgi:Carboxypeptidase regulatory-like domain